MNLGVAMQLTNILRDVGTDADSGRIYLPQQDILNYNYSEPELFKKTYNDNFKALMRFEAERARQYFVKADQSLDFDDKLSMFPARAMEHIYSKLLKKIVDEEYNVLEKKIRVNKFEKAAIAVGVWAKYSLVY